ncbi:MAG TPA: hypothetical protein DIW31_10135 [Bacteroidales bacterium]|nr:hypothetical protein [Bacteroidales bacterium]
MEPNYDRIPKRDNKRVVIGIVLLVIAAFIFADNFDILPWHWERFVFTWPSFLIFIGLIVLARKESKTTGIVLISVGAFFLAAKILYYPFGVHHLFWPAILVVIGILLIVREKNQHLFSGREK